MLQLKCVEDIKTHLVLYKGFLENRTFYEIMWKNIVERDRPQMTTWRMRIGCRIPKATDTHSEYIFFSSTATRIERRRLSVTSYVRYIVCLVWNNIATFLTTLQRRLSPFMFLYVYPAPT